MVARVDQEPLLRLTRPAADDEDKDDPTLRVALSSSSGRGEEVSDRNKGGWCARTIGCRCSWIELRAAARVASIVLRKNERQSMGSREEQMSERKSEREREKERKSV